MLIDVAFCIDEANLYQVSVVISSIVKSARPSSRHRFHIVFDGVDGDHLSKFHDITKHHDVVIYFASSRFSRHAPIGHISSAALLRVQIPRILENLDRVLYLDADLIIRRDLAQLFVTDMEGCAIAGVVDVGMYALIERLLVQEDDVMYLHMARTVGLPPETAQYINTGVMLMDLAALRATGFAERAVEVLEERESEFFWRDQDLINHLMAGGIKQLDARWNVLGSFMLDEDGMRHVPASLKEALSAQQQEQWIIHYTAALKPWNSTNVWRGEFWWEAAALSGIEWARPIAERAPPWPRTRQLYRTVLPIGVRRQLIPLKLAVLNLARWLLGMPRIIDAATEVKRSQRARAGR